MHFQSFSEFLAMGGYGFFVWLSFGITYLLLLGLITVSVYQQHQFKQQLKATIAREQRVKQYQEQQI
ncbi:MAG: heme exporter protein CcmD [Rheinheimera sp.]|uniref:heme exporter protein CcmD n=1 Tax=Arsukibacterium sp. UBA3155 TaxID=1946058 RepID=UPI000C897B62|nr:heme exporter protein CcmD [Arsukibacterium sp. UBA3155]MAD74910.1 heme exporter protein CcmD [Rheinheimera sp.]|tara:strand:- start:152063 stop:152263 length:201 start_codon:yes stop_codon:yes gene_type:complete